MSAKEGTMIERHILELDKLQRRGKRIFKNDRAALDVYLKNTLYPLYYSKPEVVNLALDGLDAEMSKLELAEAKKKLKAMGHDPERVYITPVVIDAVLG
jgi:hypothetical protein